MGKTAEPSVSSRIEWSQRASADLRQIGDFIARDRPATAARWVGRLIEDIELVAEFPLSGRRVPEFTNRTDLREVLRRSYRMVYQVHSESIVVITIFDGHRMFPGDILKALDTAPPVP